MKILLVGSDEDGALVRSLASGFRALGHEVTMVDPAPAVTRLTDRHGAVARVQRRLRARDTGARFAEAVEQLRPDATLLIKGRGVDSESVRRARSFSKIGIYYPDNPFWRGTDTQSALQRLAAADLAVVWSERLAQCLQPICQRTAVVPFGYDHQWFPLSDPATPRAGVAFVGTWHPRRERYLRALAGTPLQVTGWGWEQAKEIKSSPPSYGTSAGAILQHAAIGINVLHPHNAGAHNMRTRELAASGALQLTDPGTDGTPLRDGDGCRWFDSPAHLRELVDYYLTHSDEAIAIAKRAQELAGHETYSHRAAQFADLLGQMN